MKGFRVAGTGRCLPRRVVTNHQLSQTVDTSDEWITTRTGIGQRYFCEEETNTFLAAGAARQAMERAGITPQQVGACIVATFTPDHATPSVACLVQRELGLPNDIPCFDLNAACSGFLYGLSVAQGLLAQSDRPYALLIGSEVMSRILDFTDRSTCVLFGDGAGAVVLQTSPAHRFVSMLGSRGDEDALSCPVGGKVRMKGNDVFRFACEIIPHCIHATLQKAGRTLEEIDYVVCHQANQRIIASVVKKLRAPQHKFYLNVQRYGNTSAASIPIALDEMAGEGLLRQGSRVLCVGFGGGLTWGGALLEW